MAPVARRHCPDREVEDGQTGSDQINTVAFCEFIKVLFSGTHHRVRLYCSFWPEKDQYMTEASPFFKIIPNNYKGLAWSDPEMQFQCCLFFVNCGLFSC
jgi:hypothetical protein